MSKEGYILLSRKLQDHFLWNTSDPRSKAEAWIDLLFMARFHKEPEKRMYNGKLLTIGYGELHASLRYLAERWKWSPNKVNRFIKLLETERQIERKMEQGESIVTICNYESYQNPKKGNGTVNGTQNGTATERSRNGNGTTTELTKRKKKESINNEEYTLINKASEKVSELENEDLKATEKDPQKSCAKKDPLTHERMIELIHDIQKDFTQIWKEKNPAYQFKIEDYDNLSRVSYDIAQFIRDTRKADPTWDQITETFKQMLSKPPEFVLKTGPLTPKRMYSLFNYFTNEILNNGKAKRTNGAGNIGGRGKDVGSSREYDKLWELNRRREAAGSADETIL